MSEEEFESAMERYGSVYEFEDEMERLAEDRQRLLDKLGLTEHEWACAGGSRFEPFERYTSMRHVVEDEDEDASESGESAPASPPEKVVVDYGALAAKIADTVAAPQPPPLPAPPPLPPEALAEQLASAMSAAPPPLPKVAWTPEQRAALDQIEDWILMGYGESFFALTGPAGSGKSTLVREIADRHPGAVLSAMTGKAALRLGYCAGRSASTLYKILYWPPAPGEALVFTRVRDVPGSLIVVDEASMMTPSVYRHLQIWAADGAKILLVGDSYQLPPVITGEELKEHGDDYSVFAEISGVALETVMRSIGGVLRAATRVRQTGQIVRESDGEYEYVRTDRPLFTAVDEYLADPDDHLLITWRNAARMSANRLIRERLGRGGPLPDEGEPVLLKRNGQGFLNGEIVPCGGWEPGPKIGSLQCLYMRTGYAKILVSVDGGRRDKGGEYFDGQQWVEDFRKYHIDLKKQCLPEPIPATWGYCLTAHSAQGSEARRSTVFLERGDATSPHFKELTTLPNGDRVSQAARWAYTALTRGKMRAMMIVGR